MTTAAMRRPVSGYGEVTIIAGPNGPEVQGEVPDHIGVHRSLFADLPPALGGFDPSTGVLRLLHLRFRHIGVDGPEIFVFERIPQ